MVYVESMVLFEKEKETFLYELEPLAARSGQNLKKVRIFKENNN